MTSPAESLLDELDRRGICIARTRTGEIAVGPRAKIDRRLADLLVQYRDELKRLLMPPAPSSATDVDRKCWRCGSPSTPPPPAAQIAAIRAIQARQPPVFQWAESELARMESRMQPGDFVTMVRIEEVEIQRPDGIRYSHFRTDARRGRDRRVSIK
jgi:hypothetical protein